ncbi:hypothetical protein EV715DRAFT_208938 [Schizophyllum commune]
MTSSPSPFSSPPVSTASRPMTPPWQPLENAWKALPFAEAEYLAAIDPIDNDATKSPSAGATRIDANKRRVRFGAEMVSEITSQVPEIAAEGNALAQHSPASGSLIRYIDLVSVPMDVDEPARKVDVGAQGDEEASSKEVVAPTSKPAKLAHPATDSDVPKTPSSKPKNPSSHKQSTPRPKQSTSKPKKTKTRPVSLTKPPLLPYMCRCDDCAARRAEFLQTIGRRTVRWDEWPWCMVGDGYGTWYEEEVTDSDEESEEE